MFMLVQRRCAHFRERLSEASTPSIGTNNIPKAKQQPVPIVIYTANEIRAILDAGEPDIAPGLAIRAFAGLRLAEVARLDWKFVSVGERLIFVEANQAKTAPRRLVPIADNLAAWLSPPSHSAR